MNEDVKRIKIIIIGESGVGKTCIIKRFVYDEHNSNEFPTSSLSFATKNINVSENGVEEEIKLEVWDTVGQEKYKAMAQIFFKNSNAVILVYDITNKESFEQLKNYWIDKINEYNSNDLTLAVAANKSDLYMKEQVKEEEGREFAQKIGAIFRLTSAKNGEGIKEMFNVIGKKYLVSILNKNKIINNQCDNDFDNKKNIVLKKSNFNNNENIKNKKKCKC
jgi:small GTP-binding protein